MKLGVLSYLCLLALTGCAADQQPVPKAIWDGIETVAYEIFVRDSAGGGGVDGAIVTLIIDPSFGTTKMDGYSVPTAQTFEGTAVLKGVFPAGGSFEEEGQSSGVSVGQSVIRCEANGYKRKEIQLTHQLHFKPKELRTVKIEINLEPE